MYEELPMKKQTIQELSLMSNQTIVAEVQNEDGTWPRKTSYSKRYLCRNLKHRQTSKPSIFLSVQRLVALHTLLCKFKSYLLPTFAF